MAEADSGFWPSDIKPHIQPPLAVLRPRAYELTQQTKGVLVGHVLTTKSADARWTRHHLDVLVPSLNNFRQRLLTVRHSPDSVYPAFIDAEYFEPSVSIGELSSAAKLSSAFAAVTGRRTKTKLQNEAASDEELIDLLRRVTRSNETKEILIALIARANEAFELEAESRAAHGDAPTDTETHQPQHDIPENEGPSPSAGDATG